MPVETVEKYFLSRDYWTALLHRMKRIRERKHGDISCSPVFVQPRDLDFFKRNICICCSPPFYFSLFALGATSLRDQMTCRIFHFLLLGQDSCVSKYVRQELLHDKHSVIQSNPRLTIVCRAEWKYERLSYWISQNSVKSSCWSSSFEERFIKLKEGLKKSAMRSEEFWNICLGFLKRERQGDGEDALIIVRGGWLV